MTELLCYIEEITQIGENEYFIVNSITEEKKYTIPTNQLLKHGVSIGQKYYFKKEQNLKTKQFFLNFSRPENTYLESPSNKHYEVGEQYYFDILSIEESENKKGEKISLINIEDKDKNQISVLGLKWQKSGIWNFDKLKCEVESIQINGIPRLINRDYRHPIFEVGNEYEFQVLESSTKISKNGTFNVFILKGLDNCIHEVNMLPGQKLLESKLDKIYCKVINISTHIRLHQTNIKDPFYVTFDQIVSDNKLQKKYFNNLLNEQEIIDKNIIQLKEQYESKEAFWVFTYANKILINLFKRSIEGYDYKKAIEINNLIIIFEDWIITKGIITSFPSEEIKYNTRLKAQFALDAAKINDEVLNLLFANPFLFFKETEFFKQSDSLLEKIYTIISLCNFELIETSDFYNRLIELLPNHNSLAESERYQWIKLINIISSRKKIFLSEQEKETFSLSTSNYRTKDFKETENKYLAWSYFEIIIAKSIGLFEQFNISAGQMLKLFTKCVNEIDKKECILFNAYQYFDNYQSNELQNPFIFNHKVELNLKLLSKFNIDNIDGKTWRKLEEYYNENKSFTVNLSKKSNTGYEVRYVNLKGFLPNHHIKNNNLKLHSFEESAFSIEAKCIAFSSAFQFFIVEQTINSNVIDIEGFELKGKIGETYEAVIKQVSDYGLHISTIVGEGLVHKKEIFDFPWDVKKIKNYFKEEQRIKLQLKEFNKKNQMSFSFRQMKNTDLFYYENYIKNLFSSTTSDFFDSEIVNEQSSNFDKTITEKAYCIEQYAVLQFDLKSKLSNFKIAKQFYSNANHARSYLLNIYISYFEILQKITTALQNNSVDDIVIIRNNAIDTKIKINQKTIETFPDAEKLIFFLDILSLFNEKHDEAIEQLFSYVKKYSMKVEQKDLRTIAKISLANNLLLSESKEDSDFVLRNLRLINDYISKGILSLEETIEDKNAREMREEILYWEQRIKEDESETLEFKSSLFTPIPDEFTQKRIEQLRKIDPKNEKVIHELKRLSGDLTPKILIHSALKTLVAFANSNGGALLIGVDNNKRILGLENEYQSSSPKLQYPNRDGYGLFFDDLIRNYIGDSFSSLMTRKFLKFPDGDILIVIVKQSTNEIFLLKDDEGKSSEQLYIRNLSSSKELTGMELAKFIKNKHIGQITKAID
jgi:predicted RNA-binding protein with RPS1 domain